jgi:hypothetical protein
MDLRPVVAAAILLLGTGINWLLRSPGNPNAGTSENERRAGGTSAGGHVQHWQHCLRGRDEDAGRSNGMAKKQGLLIEKIPFVWS